MSRHQTIDLRSGVPSMFGDQATADDYVARCEVQRDEMARRGVRFSVGPAPVTVTTPTGRLIPSGTPVSHVDFLGHPNRAAWAILSDLITSGHIIESDVPDAPNPAK
ncbi:MAG: hypothetical protein ABI548_27130 [Polyangiaceae bacterium]